MAVSFCTSSLFFLLFLWPLEESSVPLCVWGNCSGSSRARKRVSTNKSVSWLAAGCLHGCSSENQSPNSQGTVLCFAWKSLCKVRSEFHPLLPPLPENSCDLLIGCQRYDCSAGAWEWLSGVESEFYNSICVRAGVQSQTQEEMTGTSDTSFLHIFCCLV